MEFQELAGNTNVWEGRIQDLAPSTRQQAISQTLLLIHTERIKSAKADTCTDFTPSKQRVFRLH